jgi:hypothetical protein
MSVSRQGASSCRPAAAQPPAAAGPRALGLDDEDEDDLEEARHGKGDYDDEPLDKRKWMTEEQVRDTK